MVIAQKLNKGTVKSSFAVFLFFCCSAWKEGKLMLLSIICALVQLLTSILIVSSRNNDGRFVKKWLKKLYSYHSNFEIATFR